MSSVWKRLQPQSPHSEHVCTAQTRLMAARCSGTQFWDSLLKSCLPCQLVCKSQTPAARCNKFCAITQCHEKLDHYYDGLLKRCMGCVDVCKGQTPECPRQCLRTTPAAVTRVPTKPVPTLPPGGASGGSGVDPSALLYAFLALFVALLLARLGLALRVCLRKPKARSTETGPNSSDHEGLHLPLEELHRESKESDPPTPTETCVCMHCYPDDRGPGQQCPIRVCHPSQGAGLRGVQDGGGEWGERDMYTLGINATEPRPQTT